MILFECPHCKNSIKVNDNASGKRGKCNNCGEVIIVPKLESLLPTAPLQNETDAFSTYSKTLKISAIALGLIVSLSFVVWSIASGSNANNSPKTKNLGSETVPSEVVSEDHEAPSFDIVSVVLPDDYRTLDDPTVVPQKVEFNGKRWFLVGYAKGVYGRTQMAPIMYTAGERNRRLIVEYATVDEEVYDKMTYEQKRVPQGSGNIDLGEIWVNDGLRENILLDGSKDRGSYKEKEPHGIHRTWYPSGQLRTEHTYYMGEMNGLARGWWENGNLQYRSIYKDGKEVEGESFDEDGNKD